MANLTFFTVTGVFTAVAGDNIYDSGADPDLVPITGSVRFTPMIGNADSLQADTLSPPTNLKLAPITARIKKGVVTTAAGAGVRLPANSAVLNIDGDLFYQVEFLDLVARGEKLQIESFTLEAPATDVTVDLVDVARVAGSTVQGIIRGPRGFPIDDVQLAGDGQSSEYFVQGVTIGTTPPPVHIIDFTGSAWPARNPGSPMAIFQGGESPGDAPNDANMRDVDVWIPTTGDNAPSAADLGLAGLYASFDQGRRVLVEYATGVTSAATPGFGQNLLGAFVTLIGSGGGAGSGRRGAAGTVRQGGGGASSGVYLHRVWLPASWFSSTFNVVLGTGGTGGAAVTTNDTDGNPGAAGGATQLVSGSNTLQAAGGTVGTGGGTGSGGVGGSAFTDGVSRPGVAVGGSASATGGVGGDGGTPNGPGSAGGGAGGGITAADVASNGGNGGGSFIVGRAVGRAGVVDTTAAAAGFFVGVLPVTVAPGGGAASKTAAAQAGGGFTSAAWGAGAAGGGASLNGNNSGAGANGAPGWLFIEWTFG